MSKTYGRFVFHSSKQKMEYVHLGPIRSNHKAPSLALHSAKALRKHIVDFKTLFIQPGCVLKLIGFLSMENIYPWDCFELNSFDYPTVHEGVGPCHMPSTREEN